MPLQEFWNEDPDLLWVYRNSYMQKMELDIETTKYKAWLYGLYNYIAIGKAFSKDSRYPTSPNGLEENKLSLADKIKQSANKAKVLIEKGR